MTTGGVGPSTLCIALKIDVEKKTEKKINKQTNIDVTKCVLQYKTQNTIDGWQKILSDLIL
jgi:3-methyladenine DNA glycosylase Mpg